MRAHQNVFSQTDANLALCTVVIIVSVFDSHQLKMNNLSVYVYRKVKMVMLSETLSSKYEGKGQTMRLKGQSIFIAL